MRFERAPHFGKGHFAIAGMTLIEVTISIFLGGMVLIGLSIAYAYAVGIWGDTERKLAMHADGTYALESIVQAASGAEAMTLGNQRLELTLPDSPLQPNQISRQRVFRLTDEALWLDDSLLTPSPGDSGIGVAAFRVEEEFDETTGTPILGFKFCLYSRETVLRASDSMWFESQVHLRNRDIVGSSYSISSEAAHY